MLDLFKSEDKKKKNKDKTEQVLDIDFIETSYGPLTIHRYKDKTEKDKPD